MVMLITLGELLSRFVLTVSYQGAPEVDKLFSPARRKQWSCFTVSPLRREEKLLMM